MPVRMSFGHRHVNFRNSECPLPLLEALPWKPMFGLDPADVIAVFHLDANVMFCGDGEACLITLVLLQSGKMVAATAYVDEMYYHTSVNMIEVTSFGELSAQWPNFAKAVGMPPAVVAVDNAQSKASTASDVVRKWESLDGACLSFNFNLSFHFDHSHDDEETHRTPPARTISFRKIHTFLFKERQKQNLPVLELPASWGERGTKMM